MMNYKTKLKQIKAVLLDVDGVLTDGSIMLMPDGSMSRNMNTKDGFAMQLAVKKGIIIGIITGGKDAMVSKRLNGLGITDVYLNSYDKKHDFEDFLYKYNLNKDDILYMGDDIPDLSVLESVGLPCCPNDAAAEVRKSCEYISPKNGGEGCVRDIIEQLLKVQGKWGDYSKIKSI